MEDVSDQAVRCIGIGEHAANHSEQLSTRDGTIRLERCSGRTFDDTGVGQCGDFSKSPMTLDIDKRGVRRCAERTGLCDAVDDGGRFGTGNITLRSNHTVRIALRIGGVIRVIQADIGDRIDLDRIPIRLHAGRPSQTGQGDILDTKDRGCPSSGYRINCGQAFRLQNCGAEEIGRIGDGITGKLIGERDRGADGGDALIGNNGYRVGRKRDATNHVNNVTDAFRFGTSFRVDSSGFCGLRFLDVSGESHAGQQADDHDEGEENTEQFAGLFHCFHSLNL